MKIIDNKKDYYDYVSGIYGIDPYVVYDRRGSEASSYIKECWPEIFDKNIIDSDKETYNRKYGKYVKDKAFIDKDFDIVIEAGDRHFFIKCNRRRAWNILIRRIFNSIYSNNVISSRYCYTNVAWRTNFR